jgi:DNA-binding NarL/FixJ family response regulator
MKDQITLAIADDHNLVREAIITMIKAEKSIKILFDVSNGRELLDKIPEHNPQIIILDIEMPILSGGEALRIIKQRYPKINVILLSSHFKSDIIIKFIKLGANSFLPKDCNRAKLLDAIYGVYKDGQYFDKEVSAIMAKELTLTSSQHSQETSIRFSEIELSIIRMICQNKINKEIAEALNMSTRTVEWHRLNIMKSLKSKNVDDLILYAVQHKLISVV